LAQIIEQQSVLDLVDRPVSFVIDLFETDSDDKRTTNMIADDPDFPALATFDASRLLGLTV